MNEKNNSVRLENNKFSLGTATGLVFAGSLLGLSLCLLYGVLVIYPNINTLEKQLDLYKEQLDSYEKLSHALWLDGALYYNHLVIGQEIQDYNLDEAYKRFSARYFSLLLMYNDVNLNDYVYEFGRCLTLASKIEKDNKNKGWKARLKCNEISKAIDHRLFELMQDRYSSNPVFSTNPNEWAIAGDDNSEGGQKSE
ncbi:MAG: hypothetical protein ACTSYD_02130 [Candidatus Heimdallarchaeaceae archaeon]